MKNSIKKEKDNFHNHLLIDFSSTVKYTLLFSTLSLLLTFSCKLIKNSIIWILLIILVLAIALCSIILYFKPIKNLKSKGFAFFDQILAIVGATSLIFAICSIPYIRFISSCSWIYFIVSISCFGTAAVLIIFRVIFVLATKPIVPQPIYLINLYNGENLPELNENFYITEKAVDYDLLGKQIFINRLYKALSRTYSDQPVVIGIEGNWGSGKTTYLKNALKKLEKEDEYSNYIINDKFEPWNYTDLRSTFISFILSIYNSLGIGTSSLNFKSTLNSFANQFLEDSKLSFFSSIFKNDKVCDDEIFNGINNYLVKNNKKLIVIIDNLERADETIVMFVYQLISSISNKLKNTKFVCLYYQKRIDAILENQQFDSDFLDKIFSLKFKVNNPTSDELYNIGRTCFYNYVDHYLVDKEYLKSSKYSKLLENLFSVQKDLRSLTILFNNSANCLINDLLILNPLDLFCVEYLKTNCFELYELIASHPSYFICCDFDYLETFDESYFASSDDKNRAKNSFIEEYFTNKDAKFSKYTEFIKELFPGFGTNGRIDSETIREFNIESRICSGRFISSYFYQDNFDFIKIKDQIFNILSSKSYSELSFSLDNLFYNHNDNEHAVLLDLIDSLILKETQFNVIHLFNYFYSRYFYFKDTSGFLVLSARNRCAIILANLLRNPNMALYKTYLGKEQKIGRLVLLTNVIYWLKNDHNYSPSQNIIGELELIIRNLRNKVFELKKSVYDREYYENGITWRLFEKEEDSKIRYFLEAQLNPKTIFPILNDFISISYEMNGKYKLFIQKSTLEKYLFKNQVDKILSITRPANSTEKEILFIYKQSVESVSDFDSGIEYSVLPRFKSDYYNKHHLIINRKIK